MLFQIFILIILELLPYDVNAQTLHNQTLEEKIREFGIVKDNPQIDVDVGTDPYSIAILNDRQKMYVASGPYTMSVISTENHTKIAEIEVESVPRAIGAFFDEIYVGDGINVSVLSAENNSKIAEIPHIGDSAAIEFGAGQVFIGGFNGLSVISTANHKLIWKIPFFLGTFSGERIIAIDSDVLKDIIYVASRGSNTVSVISTENYTKIAEISDIGLDPWAIVNDFDNVYVASRGSNTVSVISTENYTKIAEIEVGEGPVDIESNYNKHTIYVANINSNTVSVISTENHTKIADIEVGEGPVDLEFNDDTNTLYVSNAYSNGISVIDGESNKVVAGVKFNINPPESGYVKCNDFDFPLNQFLYISSTCTAKPNKGFEFISWVQNLENNSTRTVRTSAAENNYILESFYDLFGYKPDDPAASLFQFGDFTANFKALPPPISSEYLIPLYGIIITTIVGWSIPSIINWIRIKNDIKKLYYYHKEIKKIYNDGKLDKKDLDHLNEVKNSIADDYSKGTLNERHYESLQNEISISYEEIFKKQIDSIVNDSSTNKEYEKKQLIKINEDIEDAYSKSRINELHFKLLKEKVDSLKQ